MKVFSDFTETHYATILRAVCKNFEVIDIGNAGIATRECLWRHDVDMSPHRAKKIAEIDLSHGVKSHFYFMFGSRFYNLFEPAVTTILREIVKMGHHVGLHFDFSGEESNRSYSIVETITKKSQLLEMLMDQSVMSFSVHDPGRVHAPELNDDRVAGMINASSASLMNSFSYCSDSNGRWRYRNLWDVVNDPKIKRLYALTHPEWWTPDSMSARERVVRCIDGRSARVKTEYEDDLLRQGRLDD